MAWIIDNLDALLKIGMALSLLVIWILTKARWVNKEAAQEIARGIEEGQAAIGAALKGVDSKKLLDRHGKLDLDAVAAIAQKAVKGTVKQRMGKALKSVGNVIMDVAAEADPSPTKAKRPPLKRLFGLLRSRFLGG